MIKRSLLNWVLTTGSVLAVTLFSCHQGGNTLTDAQSHEVRDSVLKLAESTMSGISAKGPIAWLDQYEDSPGFFIANDGSDHLPNYKITKTFIRITLTHSIPKITLKWSDIRVDPLTVDWAVMSAGYHEDITDPSGKTTPYDGYFTAVVHKTGKGWKFRDQHWSSKPAK
jgi:ketosteroid isomerase-like protein